MSFSSFQLNPQLNANIEKLGYREPTPIQAQTIPLILQGRDVLGIAQTGTGKTAAFALPILHRLDQQGGRKGVVRVLVVVPTRELAEQVHDAFCDLGRQTGWRSMTIYGGVGMFPQVQKLRAGCEIVVACPGRLLDHLRQRTVSLRNLEMLVLDEADQMFDMGFLPSIREIVRQLPAQRQNLLFSATMPEEIRGLTAEILREPVKVQTETMAPAETVSHALYPVAQHQKTKLLLELLQRTDTESVLVFARTRQRAKRVSEQLCRAGLQAVALQGDMSQNLRRAAMEGFRRGHHRILVATDIAARGIDVSRISHVINFDMPNTVDAYTHRIGRTGRATKTGDAFTLVTHEDSSMIRAIERLLGSEIDRRKLEGFNYETVAPVLNGQPSHIQRPRPQHRSAMSGSNRPGHRRPQSGSRFASASRG